MFSVVLRLTQFSFLRNKQHTRIGNNLLIMTTATGADVMSSKENCAKNGKGQQPDAHMKRLVWIDCEMTGLKPLEQHRLVEIACIVTEPDLTVVAEFGPLSIKHAPEVMENMTEWCKETFKRNGLLERIKREGVGEREVEMKLLEFLREHVPEGCCPLAGSSVHADRRFLLQYMPQICEHLHPYRIVDVSSVKELVNRWYAGTEAYNNVPPKKEAHLALDDIRESIDLLRYYREHFFIKNGE